MRVRDQARADELDDQLRTFDGGSLVGMQDGAQRASLIGQIIDSERRVAFVRAIGARPISPLRANPASELFDPIRAALLHRANGQIDEAFWLVFLSVHFGRNLRSNWQLAREFYAGTPPTHWSWNRVCANLGVFRTWL